MSHTIGVRAASFATSAALLGIIVIAAFSVSITLKAAPDDPPFTIPLIPLAPEPPPVTPREIQPPRPLPEEPTIFDAEPPPLPPRLDLTGATTDPLPPTIGTPEITNPRWLRRPRDLARYYPPRALARGITGQVVLDCRVDVNGALRCSVVSETPANWGFGDAALEIASNHRMVPAMLDGQAVEGRYRMRVPFELD